MGTLWRSILPLLGLTSAGYTDQAVNAVSAAWRAAHAAGCLAVGSEHLRAGLADPRGRWSQSVAGRGWCRRLCLDALAVLAVAEARRAGRPYVSREDLATALATRAAQDAEPGAAAETAS